MSFKGFLFLIKLQGQNCHFIFLLVRKQPRCLP